MGRGTKSGASGKSGVYGNHAVRGDRTAEYLHRARSRYYAAEYRSRKRRLAIPRATIEKRFAAARVPNKHQSSPKRWIKRRRASDPRPQAAQSLILQDAEPANVGGAAASQQFCAAPQAQRRHQQSKMLKRPARAPALEILRRPARTDGNDSEAESSQIPAWADHPCHPLDL